MTANKISDLPRRGFQRGRQTVPAAISASGEIIFAHSPYEGVFHNGPSLQGHLLCRSDWLRLQGSCGYRVHDPLHAKDFCLSSMQCVRTVQSKQSAPRRDGPCRPQRFLTNSAGSHIQCLGLGAWAEPTAPAPGAQTVSTARIRISGNCVGKRVRSGRKAAPRPYVSFCVSRGRSLAASVCELGDRVGAWQRIHLASI